MPLSQSSEKFTNPKEFLKGLKGVDFKMEESKAGMLNSLDHSGGYKLTKGEALYQAGKLKSVEEMNNAAARSLDEQDLNGFLDQYGGDKYVKRVFVYGVSKMKRDLLMREMKFEEDKEKGGAFTGLKNYATFQEAFAAGFYKDFNLSYESIMEKGLSVSEYRQRNKRLRKLERKIKAIEEKEQEAPAPMAAPEEKKIKVKVRGAEKKEEEKRDPTTPEKQTIEEVNYKRVREAAKEMYKVLGEANEDIKTYNERYKLEIDQGLFNRFTEFPSYEKGVAKFTVKEGPSVGTTIASIVPQNFKGIAKAYLTDSLKEDLEEKISSFNTKLVSPKKAAEDFDQNNELDMIVKLYSLYGGGEVPPDYKQNLEEILRKLESHKGKLEAIRPGLSY